MKIPVYLKNDTLYINEHAIPAPLRPHLPTLLKELQGRYASAPLNFRNIDEISREIVKWVKRYEHTPPNASREIALPKIMEPAPSGGVKGGFVVEVRARVDGKTVLKRYSCVGFDSLEEAIAHMEKHPEVVKLPNPRLSGFHDENMQLGDKRRTYVIKEAS